MSEDIGQILHEHKQFLYSGRTSDLQFRLDQLRKLQEVIQRYESQIALLYIRIYTKVNSNPTRLKLA